MKQIFQDTLEIVESINGFYLYGHTTGDCKYFIACLGDGVDSIYSDLSYDPNDDMDLPEAYGFELVP